jgi:hypothetical protein
MMPTTVKNIAAANQGVGTSPLSLSTLIGLSVGLAIFIACVVYFLRRYYASKKDAGDILPKTRSSAVTYEGVYAPGDESSKGQNPLPTPPETESEDIVPKNRSSVVTFEGVYAPGVESSTGQNPLLTPPGTDAEVV